MYKGSVMKNKCLTLLICLLLYNEGKAAAWIRLGPWSDMVGETFDCYAGASISITPDGSIIAVGQPGVSSNMGQVNIYQYALQSNETLFRWTGPYTISGENPNDQAGSSVALSSNNGVLFVVAFGEPGYSGDTGRVRIYLSDNQFDRLAPSSWNIIGAITGENGNDKSGASISITNNAGKLIIGEPGWSGNTGRIRIYLYPNWDLIYTATGESANNQFGASVAINKEGGATFIVGEPGWSGNAGRVHVYGGLAIDQDPPFEMGTITGNNINDQAGFSVAIYSDPNDIINFEGTVVAFGEIGFSGSDGRVRIYNLTTEGFEQIGAITGENGNALGYSISLNDDGTAIAIGAPLDTNNAGKVFVYRYTGTTWQQQGNFISSFCEENLCDSGRAGYSVSLSSDGNTVGLGAPYANSQQGIVQVFRYRTLFKQADMIYNFLSLAADKDMSHAISPGKGLMLAEQGQVRSKCFSSTGICHSN